MWNKLLPPWRTNTLLIWIVAIVIAAAGFLAGWVLNGFYSHVTVPQSLHLNGYQFIDPLLLCNVNNSTVFPQDQTISTQMQSVIDADVNLIEITKASVYFANLTNGEW